MQDKKVVRLEFALGVALHEIHVPCAAKPFRTNDLWRTTCFELFLQGRNGEYIEFNFSPSTQWAAYHFSAYRAGMTPLEIDPPIIRFTTNGARPHAAIQLNLPPHAIGKFGLSAVVEETDGTKSYWALRHPPGVPDFHHPDCFALELPAPAQP